MTRLLHGGLPLKSTRDFDEITVFGARGHSVMILRELDEAWGGRVRIRALIDDIENGFIHPTLGIPVISSAVRLRDFHAQPVLLTVLDPALRQRVALGLAAEGATLATAVFPDAPHVDPQVSFGAGVICMPWTRLGQQVVIGDCALLLAAAVAHDVEIGTCVSLAGEAMVMGHVQIGRNVTLAPRAVIANGTRGRPLRIGEGAEIGAGAVVVGHVRPGARLIGNPAMPIRDWVRLRRLLRRPDAAGSPPHSG